MEGIRKAGILVGARKELNLREGDNVTLTVADSTVVNNTIDVEIDVAAGAGGLTIKEAGVAQTARAGLNFGAGFDLSDDAGNDETDVALDASEVAAAPTASAFGDTSVTGAAATFANSGHQHAREADPVTAHAAAADPHTGYRLESADHTHQSTGLQGGKLDHGLALDGLTDDDHTQYTLTTELDAHTAAADPHTGYVLESLLNAKGDLISASADNTPSLVTVGADDTILMADAAQIAGLKWVASGTPSTQAFGDAAVVGTEDTFTRGDHKHAMMADPVTAHAAAADPHTGYRLESADHSHQSAGAQAGTLDHGLALTGLTDDDHTQYRLESVEIVTADIANDAVTYAKIQDVSATDRLLGRDTVGAGNVEEITPSAARTMLDVPSTSEAVLDTIVDAKGDLIAGTAADTVARLAVGTDNQVLTAASGEATGMKWAAAGGGGSASAATRHYNHRSFT